MCQALIDAAPWWLILWCVFAPVAASLLTAIYYARRHVAVIEESLNILQGWNRQRETSTKEERLN